MQIEKTTTRKNTSRNNTDREIQIGKLQFGKYKSEKYKSVTYKSGDTWRKNPERKILIGEYKSENTIREIHI